MKAVAHRLIDQNHTNTIRMAKPPGYAVDSVPSRSWICQLLFGVVLFVVLGFLPGLVLALPAELPSDIGAGSLFVKGDQGEYVEALRMQSEVHFDISGLVSRATLKQYFKNDSSQWMEGVYVFPLPDQSAVDRLQIRVGERIIKGVIKEKAQAKAMYTQARRDGKRAALVEQERPNMFTTSVANIGPGETVVVEIAYQQTLEYREGRFSLEFPMTITPRYIPGAALSGEPQNLVMSGHGWAKNTDQVPDASRVTPPVVRDDSGARNAVNITASLDAGFPLAEINSLYHEIRIQRRQQLYDVSLFEQVAMDRDFELVWTPAVGSEPDAAFFKQSLDGEDYGLIMIMPPQADQGLKAMQQALPREVILVIDTSGSMAGQSIEQARRALLMALDTLTPADRFNVVEFNSVTRKLFSQAVYADPQSINVAKQFVTNLRSGGGTEMAAALNAALQDSMPEGFLRQVIFITDGSVGNEAALFSLIEKQLASSRLFTVGIGSAPNSYFMRRAAEFGRGTYTFVRSHEEITSRMQTLFDRLKSPVISDLQLDWVGTAPTEIWPQRITDLYSREPVIVAVKLNDNNHQLILKGKMLGHAWQRTLQLGKGESREGIASIWARKKIAGLMDEHRRNGGAEDIRQQIVELAMHHQLVSKYTSLVAIDPQPVRPASDELKTKAIANNLPAGSQQIIPGSGFPQTATPSRLHLLIALFSLLIAAGVFLKQRYEA